MRFTDKIEKAINLAIDRDIDDPLDIDIEDWEHYGLPVFEIDGCEYAIAHLDSDAENAATEAIKQSLWAFNSDFLAGETGLPSEVFSALSARCEDSNDAVLSLIEKTCGLSSFVESAIASDGRGHFISPYDGDEIELENGCGYLYRIN
jgi:hypothetical protein